MRFSYNLLKKLAKLEDKISPLDLAKALTNLGFEVEKVGPFIDGPLHGLAFGKILEISKNPQDPKLNVCQIIFGDKAKRTIQTNSANVQVGHVVLAFLPGSVAQTISFESKVIKGVLSEGMLSSWSELGIDQTLLNEEQTKYVTIYDTNLDLKLDFKKYLGLDDYIIEVKVLSNRPDANAYLVMAMELSAYYESNCHWSDFNHSNFAKTKDLGIKTNTNLKFAKIQALPSFSIDEQLLLIKSGLKCSDNLLSNYENLTLLMTGQPVHLVSLTNVQTTMQVDLATQTFSHAGINYEQGLAIVQDGSRILCAVGVQNQASLEKHDAPVLIVTGNFSHALVRENLRQAKKTSHFGQQLARELAPGLFQYAISFLANFSQLETNQAFINHEPRILTYAITSFEKLIQIENSTSNSHFLKAKHALEQLGYQFKTNQVIVPLHLSNVKNSQTINAELLRFYKYENIVYRPEPKITKPILIASNQGAFVAHGLLEVRTYTLVDEKSAVFNPWDFKRTWALKTFVSQNHAFVRNSMLPSLNEVIAYNQKRKMDHFACFERGMINHDTFVYAVASTYHTFDELALIIKQFYGKPTTFQRSNHAQLHDGVSAWIIDLQSHTKVGWIGKAHPSLELGDFYFAEIIDHNQPNNNLAIINHQSFEQAMMKQRDLTFILNHHDEAHGHLNALTKISGIYRIMQIDDFKKDQARHLTFRIWANDEATKVIDETYNLDSQVEDVE